MKNIYLIPFLFLLTSCAFTRDHVTVGYQPNPCPVKVEQAENVVVNVHVTDSRPQKEFVGCKKNGYGMECAYIVADNDVAEVLRHAIVTELQGRGFIIAEGETEVNVELCKFKNNFEIGFLGNEAASESVVNLIVRDCNGTIKYSKTVFGSGAESKCFLNNGSNASKSLEAALNDTVQKIVNDPIFIDSLLKS